MTTIKRLRLRLSISSDEYLAYYRQLAKDVVVTADNGSTVRFPASALQRFVQHDGVHGRFELHFSESHKLLDLIRINENK